MERTPYFYSMISDKRLPKAYRELRGDAVISNFEGKVNPKISKVLQGRSLFSRYVGWDFNGLVWFSEGEWYCELWHLGEYRYTLVASTLAEIQEDVTAVFGPK